MDFREMYLSLRFLYRDEFKPVKHKPNISVVFDEEEESTKEVVLNSPVAEETEELSSEFEMFVFCRKDRPREYTDARLLEVNTGSFNGLRGLVRKFAMRL